jgi:hypothetical protein
MENPMPQANPQSTTSQAQQGIADTIERLIALLEATRMNGDPVRSDSEAKGQPSKRRTKMKSASLRLASSTAEPATTAGEDMVAQLGKDLARAFDIYGKAEDFSVDAKRAGLDRNPLDVRAKIAWGRYDMLAEAIPAHCASSLAGSIVALMRASALADLIHSTDYSDNEYQEKAEYRRLQACLYSALHPLRAAVPGVYEECGGEYFMPERLDPFQSIAETERAIQEVAKAVAAVS